MAEIGDGIPSSDERDMHVAIGRLLGDARQAAGLPQSAVARRLGMPQSRLARTELGKRRLLYAEAVRLARLYGVDISAFDPRGRSAADTVPIAGRRKRIDLPRLPRKPNADE